MPDIFYLIRKWRKQVLLVVLSSLVIAAAIVFLMPPQYLASTTALPANPVSADKSTVFNENIKDFYNSLGQSGDLDKIVGTGQLDTLYLAITDQFDLIRYYQIKISGPAARIKAAKALKKEVKIAKSEYGELLIQVWNKDKHLAPIIANAMMEKLGAMHQELLNRNNQTILASLRKGMNEVQERIDSIHVLQQAGVSAGQAGGESYTDQLSVLNEQARQYQKLAAEYRLMLDTKPVALLVIEKARAGDRPDKPRKLLILVATVLLSFLFAIWLAVIQEKRKSQHL